MFVPYETRDSTIICTVPCVQQTPFKGANLSQHVVKYFERSSSRVFEHHGHVAIVFPSSSSHHPGKCNKTSTSSSLRVRLPTTNVPYCCASRHNSAAGGAHVMMSLVATLHFPTLTHIPSTALSVASTTHLERSLHAPVIYSRG